MCSPTKLEQDKGLDPRSVHQNKWKIALDDSETRSQECTGNEIWIGQADAQQQSPEPGRHHKGDPTQYREEHKSQEEMMNGSEVPYMTPKVRDKSMPHMKLDSDTDV